MLRNYVNEHQNDWDEFASVLTYAYNNHVHRSTGTTPFYLVLSRPPMAFSLYHNERGVQKPSEEQRDHYIEQLGAMLQKAYDRLLKRNNGTNVISINGYDPRTETSVQVITFIWIRRMVPRKVRSQGSMRLVSTESLRTTVGLSSSNVMTKWRGLTRIG